MRLIVSNFGGDIVGKELEEKLKVSFSIYGKISCTHLLDTDNEFYLYDVVVFIIPNNNVLAGKLIIPNKFLVRKDLPIATSSYEPAEVKCIHCKSNTHNSNHCETVDSLKKLFELTDINLDSYEKV
ncbi:hypothetical protein K502DRAFT_325796 [Neoconidiobolus thromboides FSU 785]|nr:hypothetical protein K502DRAFT_325796 [Neoconidiobolus thromboides FSU 785]